MLHRRKFIGTALGATLASMLPMASRGQKIVTSSTNIIRPKRLKKGDTIGLVAPGYAITEEILEEAKTTLKSMGFVPYHTNRILWRHGYFSNTDIERARDFNELILNPEIDGILCARGGYGCTRIMDLIDYKAIKQHPKAVIGFSDITALLNGIHQETGLITFHGPVGSTINNAFSTDQFQRILMHPSKNLMLKNADITTIPQNENPEYERYTITAGSAKGVLVGGSLTLINALIGTPHEIDFTDTIVCIEDVEEAPYRIDRMLTQLIAGTTFSKAAGIVFGVCAGCNSSTNPNSFTLKEVILDRISPLKIPAIYGMSFGHIDQNFTFPIGIKAHLDANQMSLQLVQNPVL